MDGGKDKAVSALTPTYWVPQSVPGHEFSRDLWTEFRHDSGRTLRLRKTCSPEVKVKVTQGASYIR